MYLSFIRNCVWFPGKIFRSGFVDLTLGSQLVYNFVNLKSFRGEANWGKEVPGVMSLGTVFCPWFPLCHEDFLWALR